VVFGVEDLNHDVEQVWLS